jgi:hypothetical protein
VVPSILFTPQKPAENATNGGGYVMDGSAPGVPLYSVFWGSYWNTPGGQAYAASLENALNQMFLWSPYLNGLHQYGVTNPVFVPGGTVTAFNSSDPTPGFDQQWLFNTVQNAISNQGIPDSDTYSNEGIYLCFTTPGIYTSGDSGYHSDDGWHDFLDYDNLKVAWVGTDGTLDGTTWVLSHEVAEALTDPQGDAWQVDPRNGSNWNEICDNEAQSYKYRINGYLMQAYWSQADGSYEVTDGNTQNFVVNNGVLTVNGDQLGPSYNDTITIDENALGGVQVTLNGEVASFDPGAISSITVNPGYGTDTVNIERTLAGVPVTVNLGGPTDTVNISPGAENLDNIQSDVTVNTSLGVHDGTLNINDQQNHNFQSMYTVTGTSIDRGGGAILFSGINNVNLNSDHSAIYTVSGTEDYCTTTLNTGSGMAQVNVQFTGTGSTLNIDSNGGSGNDVVRVGDAGSVANILGTVNIENPADVTTLYVDDSADSSAQTVTLDTFTPNGDSAWGSITLLSATINYEYADTNSVNLQTGTYNGLLVNVLATGDTTNLVGNGTTTVQVGNNGNVLPIQGTLNIDDPNGSATLTVDDSADTAATTVTQSGNPFTNATSGYEPWGSIVFQGPNPTSAAGATINYEYADTASVTIKGGTASNVYKVVDTGSTTILNPGFGADSVMVGHNNTLEYIQGALTVSGGSNTGLLINDQAGPSATYTLTASTLARAQVATITFSGLKALLVNGGTGPSSFVASALPSITTTLMGGSGPNSLTGPNTGPTWTINGANAGQLGKVIFNGFANLVGGSGTDTFKFVTGGSLSGSLDGGLGGNWIDYAGYSGPIGVNLSGASFGPLPADSATAVNGGAAHGITHLAFARAGSGNATLVGGGGNILVGGAGNDMLVDTYAGNSLNGASLLIGGLGADTLKGGSAGDLLIGGVTSYSNKNVNLQHILNYWRTHSHSAAFTTLQSASGLPTTHERLIWGTTVMDDGSADQLFGTANASAVEWFFAGVGDTLTNGKHGTDYLNNGLY